MLFADDAPWFPPPLLIQSSFPIRSKPIGLTSGPDGGLWYTTAIQTPGRVPLPQGWIGRLDPTSGIAEETKLGDGIAPTDIESFAGRVWFGEDPLAIPVALPPHQGLLRSFDPALGPLSATSVPLDERVPSDLSAGPDGVLWFTTSGFFNSTLGPGPSRVEKLLTDGTPTTVIDAPVAHLATSPDGTRWITRPELRLIGRVRSTGEYAQFVSSSPGFSPSFIAVGPDGAMWFTESGVSRIGRISDSGEIEEYAIPSGEIGRALATGPDGRLWFRTSDALIRVAVFAVPLPGGLRVSPLFAEFPAPFLSGGETLIVGPDGHLWYGAGNYFLYPAPELRGVLVRVETQDCPAGDLCLAGRFRVHLDRQDAASGEVVPAVPVAQNTSFGYFWFFSANNVEVAVKIVDGRPVDSHFWVFAASLTDVAFTLTVTDTATGLVQRYDKPAGQFTTFADTSTF